MIGSPVPNLEPKCIKGPILYLANIEKNHFGSSWINFDGEITSVKLAHVWSKILIYGTKINRKSWPMMNKMSSQKLEQKCRKCTIL
jgi:hypothetical protein